MRERSSSRCPSSVEVAITVSSDSVSGSNSTGPPGKKAGKPSIAVQKACPSPVSPGEVADRVARVGERQGAQPDHGAVAVGAQDVAVAAQGVGDDADRGALADVVAQLDQERDDP